MSENNRDVDLRGCASFTGGALVSVLMFIAFALDRIAKAIEALVK